jgi:hypothetical protein
MRHSSRFLDRKAGLSSAHLCHQKNSSLLRGTLRSETWLSHLIFENESIEEIDPLKVPSEDAIAWDVRVK